MLKIGILGLAADPPHLGHLDVARFVLTNTDINQIWLLPCFKHNFGKEMISSDHRITMCQELVKSENKIIVSDYEIVNKISGGTYCLVKRLYEDFNKSEYDFSMIIGMDNALVFNKWANYKLLEKTIKFVVVPRPGYICENKDYWFLHYPHIFLKDLPIRDISSTQVRKLIKERKTEELITAAGENIANYIFREKLYL